ncbi:Uu.00g102880.m01.CDS01 [Anthostomella pinea]|uniref:Uu.00g102880.m01.CDS01 n=1 Tax=Anthostomella pinea TaxID=933095 RepID=A0AAI8YFP1_9PEZI|nr:Uu.00g102880.m01.CDS01 [Anthostomella pinea]
MDVRKNTEEEEEEEYIPLTSDCEDFEDGDTVSMTTSICKTGISAHTADRIGGEYTRSGMAYGAVIDARPRLEDVQDTLSMKMFIGGLNWETTDDSLRDYFSQFGEVTECTVMRDGATGRSRGFGFLTFKDPKTVNIVMVKEHFLDGKLIDPKRAIPRDEQEKTSKIFVGGVSQDTTENEFKEYFAQFGRVVDATLMMDKDTGRPRGFGFVTFESEAGVDACLSTHLEIHGKPIEVKKAQPRGNMREEEEASRRGKFKKGGMDDQGANQNQMANQMGQGGMTPQSMAQYMQRMQQYMTMMQQQMAMNRGMAGGMGAMNPAMMQMMQIQQMQQQMAQGGGGANPGNNPMAGMAGMANMNPAMMQQMQNQMMGNGGAGQAQGQGNDDQQGFNDYNNQQQMYNQRGGGGRRGGRGAYNQNYGNMAGGGGGGGGDPTSWEGMYDDVPQPNANPGGRGGFHRNRGSYGHHSPAPSDPTQAPPPNAPTGPKNAGRPGANYRGGGRGGNRGYHPYGR